MGRPLYLVFVQFLETSIPLGLAISICNMLVQEFFTIAFGERARLKINAGGRK